MKVKTSKAIDTQVYKLDNLEAQFMRQVLGYSCPFSESVILNGLKVKSYLADGPSSVKLLPKALWP